MDFRLDDGQLALQDVVRGFCAKHHSLDRFAANDDAAVAFDRARWRALGELGTFGLMVPEAEGGAGLGLLEAVVVAEQLGAHLVPGPIIWTTLAAAHVEAALDGSVVVGGLDTTVDGSLLLEHAPDLDSVLVVGGDSVALCERAGLGPLEELEPLDPLTPVARLAAVPPGSVVGDAAAAAALRVRGTVLAAGTLVGLADAALGVARHYALEREQFGVAIGSFQAIKHMLADMHVRVGLARAAAYASAAVVDDPEAGDDLRLVSSAKLLAGDAAIDNAKVCIQILGGMGFTWEMPAHLLLKRAWVLEAGFGTGKAHALRVAAALAAEVA